MADEAIHNHPSSWSFPCPPETRVNTTRQVLEGEKPILLVKHTQKGTWLLHCGTTQDLKDKRGACLGCLVGEHPELAPLGDLPAGEHAHRDHAAAPWQRVDTQRNKKILDEAVAANGWQTVLLPPQRPLWGFTVGLGKTYGHPEMFVMGLPGPVMFGMLEGMAAGVKEGVKFAAGMRSDEIVERLSCELEPVHPAWHELMLGPLLEYYAGQPFEVLQCLWPDGSGKLPSDEGYDPANKIRQPELQHGDAERAGLQSLLHAMGRG